MSTRTRARGGAQSASQRKREASKPKTEVSSSGVTTIKGKGEPIHIGRDPLDAVIPNKDIRYQHDATMLFIRDELLTELKIGETRYASDSLSDEERRTLFLRTYAKFGSTRAGCTAARVTRSDILTWRMDVEGFRESMDNAFEDAVDELEAVARERATTGRPWKEVTEVVSDDGVTVTTKSGVEHSDSLLMFLLRGQRSKYGTSRTEVTGKEGGAIEVKEIVMTVVDPQHSELANASK